MDVPMLKNEHKCIGCDKIVHIAFEDCWGCRRKWFLSLDRRREPISERVFRVKVEYESGHYIPERTELNEWLVKQIRHQYDSGQYSQASLAEKYNVSKTVMQRICRRLTWTDV